MIYAFFCDTCQTETEVEGSPATVADLKPKCPTCKKKLRRLYGTSIHVPQNFRAGEFEKDFNYDKSPSGRKHIY